MEEKYRRIIDLERPASERYAKMPISARAAQFAPFAALTGYEECINEEGRITEARQELSEDAKSLIDAKLRAVAERIETFPEVSVTYFVADRRKSGGSYVTVTGAAKRIEAARRTVLMKGGISIPIDDIFDIDEGNSLST